MPDRYLSDVLSVPIWHYEDRCIKGEELDMRHYLDYNPDGYDTELSRPFQHITVEKFL